MDEKFYKLISLPEAKILVEKNQNNPDFVVLDVRTQDELRSGVVGQPMNVDIYESNFAEEIGKLDRNRTYLVYCRSGNRSCSATNFMKESGFSYIYEIEKGILG